jgi:type II secretory pathway predicted ATPase ExeA
MELQDGKLALLSEFGFTRDPFAGVRMETSDTLRIKRLISMAIDSRAMVAITAARGMGKTEAIRQALAERDIHEVRILSADKERLVIADIERELIYALRTNQEEAPRRTRVVRAHQLRRIAGDAAKKKSVVLVLEEAHRMHAQTLRSLKTLREMDWMGMSPLFTVIMVGQFNPFRQPGLDEVRLRTDRVEMRGLLPKEIKEYIGHTVGRCFEDDAAEAVGRITGCAQNFLELQHLLCRLLDTALRHGHKKVRAIDVFAATGGGLAEVLKKADISQADIARETGISKSEINMVANGKPGAISADRAQATTRAILNVVAKRLGEKQVADETKEGAA